MFDRLLARPQTTAAALILLGGLAAILAAWGYELIGGYVPCKLCLEQRDPYYLGLPVALLALLSDRLGGPAWLTRGALAAVALIFAYGAALGIYQAGSQWGFWAGPTDCGATRGATIPGAATDLLGSLNKVKIASCTEVDWRMLGLSFAGWNAVVSAGIVVLALAGAVLRPRAAA
ncbi:disulfide bond formation protein B [Prosthecomicrobium sp. N25]|uniref:disulfide bond formation protein B n=1 Tax=Prosthecomicrobium sp. N25 TaxID=3129254 RepID=UPI0030787017